MHQNAISTQVFPAMRFLVFGFGVYALNLPGPWAVSGTDLRRMLLLLPIGALGCVRYCPTAYAGDIVCLVYRPTAALGGVRY
eukprot:378144-Rhodomonas_salina.1